MTFVVTFTPEQEKKMELLDRVFESFTSDELEQMFGATLVVGKLKGIDEVLGPIAILRKQNVLLEQQISLVNSKVYSLDYDIKELLRLLNGGLFNQTTQSNFYNLKVRHNIY